MINEISKQERCTLSDTELLSKASELIRKLAETGGRSWSLSVPVDFNNDPDMIFCEICSRYEHSVEYINELLDEKKTTS